MINLQFLQQSHDNETFKLKMKTREAINLHTGLTPRNPEAEIPQKKSSFKSFHFKAPAAPSPQVVPVAENSSFSKGFNMGAQQSKPSTNNGKHVDAKMSDQTSAQFKQAKRAFKYAFGDTYIEDESRKFAIPNKISVSVMDKIGRSQSIANIHSSFGGVFASPAVEIAKMTPS